MTATTQPTALPTSSKVLCLVYAVIAVAALIATWSQNIAYLDRGGQFLTAFWEDTKVNPASRSVAVDLGLFLLAAAILMVIEARRHDVKFVWVYILGGFVTAISVTFPLFLLARELRVGRTSPSRLGSADMIGLILLAVFVAAFTIWVDVV
jgi:hypothetical protein